MASFIGKTSLSIFRDETITKRQEKLEFFTLTKYGQYDIFIEK